MRFGNLRKSVTREYMAHAGRVEFVHQVDAKHESNRQSLFGRKLGEQRMLGAAGAARLSVSTAIGLSREKMFARKEGDKPNEPLLDRFVRQRGKKQRLWNRPVLVTRQV